MLTHDLRRMDDFTSHLVTAPEVLAIQQDPDCVQGSLARSLGSGEVWIKPLSDGSFGVVLFNKGTTVHPYDRPVSATNIDHLTHSKVSDRRTLLSTYRVRAGVAKTEDPAMVETSIPPNLTERSFVMRSFSRT